MNTIKINRFFLTAIFAFISFVSGIAQGNSVKYDLSSLSANNMLDVFNRKVTAFTENDRNCIRFSKNENDGVAWLKHVIFSNGIIELDIRGKDELQQSFVGIAFHGKNDSTYDAIYFRPFNFKNSERKGHSVQYISHPEFT